jgi:NAD-dependent DNA ligase
MKASEEDFLKINGIGPIVAKSLFDFFKNKENLKIIKNLLKEVKIISSKRNLKNDLNSVIRTLTFEPANFSEIKISVDRFESKVKGFPQVESYKDMPSEAKIHVIKLIDDILVNAIFRFDTFVQKSKEGKLEATINNVKEL